MDRLVRFRPTDEQLFAHFLVGKATSAPLPPNPIEERDIYNQEPWEIFDAASDRTFYVFTTLRKNKSRVLRTAGSGTWKEQHSSKITNSGGELIGHRKSFKFKGGRDLIAMNGHWIMYEFSMCDGMQCKHVLCKIKYHKDEKKSEEKTIIIPDDILVQFEDENQRVKRACLLNDYGDRTYTFYDSTLALPSYTADQARPIPSRAVSSGVPYAEPLQMSTGWAAALHLDIDDLAFPGFSGGTNADSLSPLATATIQRSGDEWMKGWMTTELDPVVHYGYNSMSRSPAPMEGGCYTNMLAPASSPPITNLRMTTTPAQDTRYPTTLAFGRNATLDPLFATSGVEAATMRRDICYAGYPQAIGCNRDADVRPTNATSEQEDTTYLAFDGVAYVDLHPSTAEQAGCLCNTLCGLF